MTLGSSEPYSVIVVFVAVGGGNGGVRASERERE